MGLVGIKVLILLDSTLGGAATPGHQPCKMALLIELATDTGTLSGCLLGVVVGPANVGAPSINLPQLGSIGVAVC